MKRLILPLVFSLFSAGATIAQTGEDLQDPAVLNIRIKNINFLRDNEYSNPLTEGYTLIGFLIQPSLVYIPSDRLKISLGAQVLSYAGTYKIKSPALVFSTGFRVFPHTTLTLGSLDGCDRHRLDDQISYSERTYTAHTESGVRIATEKDHVFNDTWVNWENFISRGDTTREVFVAGESFNYSTWLLNNKIHLDIPVQGTFKHLGGQISDYPEHVETFFDGSAGIKLGYKPGTDKKGTISIEFKQFRYQYITLHGTFELRQGNASRLRLIFEQGHLMITSGLWKSRNFYSPEGNPVFSSWSQRDPVLFIHDRSIWMSSAGIVLHQGDYFEFFAGGETFYDLNRGHLDSELSLHLRFDRMFTIHKFR